MYESFKMITKAVKMMKLLFLKQKADNVITVHTCILY